MIDTLVVKKLLELDEEKFQEFDNFINELIQLFKYKDFKQTLKYYKKYQKGKRIRKSYVVNKVLDSTLDDFGKKAFVFFQKYDCFLETFFNWYLDCVINSSNLKIYNHIKENYNQKDNMLEIINRLIELGLDEVKYEPAMSSEALAIFQENGLENVKLELNCSIRVTKTEPGEKIIEVYGLKTNGSITWIRRRFSYNMNYVTEIYPVKIENADFIVEYKKNTSETERKATIKNLLFDSNLLPTKEEVNDLNVLPYIDMEAVEKADMETRRFNARVNELHELNKLRVMLGELDGCIKSVSSTESLNRLKSMKNLVEKAKALGALDEAIENVEQELVELSIQESMNMDKYKRLVKENK